MAYDYKSIAKKINRKVIEKRPQNLWRYRELLPIDGDPQVGLKSGYTPLVKADNLARELGLDELYIKDDTVVHPTLSFKDRVVAIALTKAKEFGFDTVACASTGNLAHSVSAHGAKAGFKRFIFIPASLEASKIVASLVYEPNLIAVDGNYDEVNRTDSLVRLLFDCVPWDWLCFDGQKDPVDAFIRFLESADGLGLPVQTVSTGPTVLIKKSGIWQNF